jgi:hypothetical protein
VEARWLPVVGYEGKYEVSDDGRVRSLRRSKELKQWPNQNGYLRVTLFAAGKGRGFAVHRLVLAAFVGPAPEGHLHTLHGNGVRNDNRLANLSWGTAQDNADDRRKHGTDIVGEKNHNARLTEEQVRCILLDARGLRRLSREFGVSRTVVQAIRAGRAWKHVPRPTPEEAPDLLDLLRKARQHLPLAAASWNEEPEYAIHTDAVLTLMRDIDAVIAAS